MIYKRSLLKIPLLASVFIAALGCQDEVRETDSRSIELDSLSTELARQQQINDSLQSLMNNSEMAAGFPIYFGREFDTIPNPEEYIASALKQQKELIPLEGVLGGTMEFRQVQVLTEDWVLAIYDDGHVQGKSIYEYELEPDGEIEFSEVISELPNSR